MGLWVQTAAGSRSLCRKSLQAPRPRRRKAGQDRTCHQSPRSCSAQGHSPFNWLQRFAADNLEPVGFPATQTGLCWPPLGTPKAATIGLAPSTAPGPRAPPKADSAWSGGRQGGPRSACHRPLPSHFSSSAADWGRGCFSSSCWCLSSAEVLLCTYYALGTAVEARGFLCTFSPPWGQRL